MDYFEEYIKNYDLTNPEILYKYYHSKRVMDNMEVLAKSMNLPIKDVYLAKIIGLYHDIGRFKQYTNHQNYDNELLDHGTYGKEILEQNKVLSKLDIPKEDYSVVYKSISNHNKYEIEKGLNKRELLFSQMIRDADKLDILYAIGNKKIKPYIYEDDSIITNEVKQTFLSKKTITKDKIKNKNDGLITMFSYIYDINFNSTLYIIKKNRYYEKILKRLKDKEKFTPYIDYIKTHIKERTN